MSGINNCEYLVNYAENLIIMSGEKYFHNINFATRLEALGKIQFRKVVYVVVSLGDSNTLGYQKSY
jgi:hypothetical protein